MPPQLDTLRAALAGRYEVDRELGRGGMATVYLAEDVRHHRKVAMKVLSPDLAQAIGAERFLREIETIARLRHPHILPLYDSGEAAGLLFYVMPFVEGETLRDRLNREKQLSVDDALQLAREVADALSYAHTHGVVHRDVKPENILIDSGHAVVADFGISKAIANAGGDQLTETGLSVGTPTYMSPEQASGGEVDGRSDLYALGCVLYEMLAGKPPFTGPTMESVVRQHLTLEPTPLSALRPAVPSWVASAVARSLAKAPADRFNPVAQFSDALRAPASTAATPATAATAAPPNRRSLVLGGVVATLAIVAAVWVVNARKQGGAKIDSLAVLPLQNLSGDSTQGFFVDGVHDALIGELAKISGLRVASRTSAMSYRANPKPTPIIAKELGVAAVVEGSVFRSGDSVRIQVQLIATDPERHIWAESYQRDVRNLVGVMGDVARTIAQAVKVTLTPQEMGGLSSGRTVNPVAQDHFLRGRQLLFRRDREGLLGSISEFRAALRLDSTHAGAYAALSNAYTLSGVYGVIPRDSAYPWHARALAAANRAIDLDSLNAEAWAARGYEGMFAGASDAEVEADYRRAIALKPSYADAYGWLAQLLRSPARRREAFEAADRALVLDPVSPGMRVGKAVTAFFADSAELAVELLRAIRTMRPDIEPAWVFEGLALAILGREAECLALDGVKGVPRAICLHSAGRRAEAVKLIEDERARADAGRGSVSSNFEAYYFAWAGQPDDAIRSFERSIRSGPFNNWAPASHRSWSKLRPDERGRVTTAMAKIRADAWARIVAESRKVVLP
jgi:serine/threonine-protein kinase